MSIEPLEHPPWGYLGTRVQDSIDPTVMKRVKKESSYHFGLKKGANSIFLQ